MGFPAKISLIIPVYNVADYLPKCLESCLNQTLYDVEIICVNDGSTDSSGEILKYYEQKDPRINVITKPNGGLSSARNAGLDVATGSWIMFLDSDDFLATNACERVWRETLEDPTDIVIFGTEIFPVFPEVPEWYRNVLYTRTCRYNQFTPQVLFEEPGGKPFVWRQAFSKSLLEKTGVRFHEELRFGEDLPFQFEIFPHAENFAFIADRLYQYRWARENSLMSVANRCLDYKIEQHLIMAKTIAENWEKNGFMKKYPTQFLAWLLEFFVYDLKQMELENRAEHARKVRELVEQFRLNDSLHSLKTKDKKLWTALNV